MTFDPAYAEGPTPHSDNLLDRWILARLNQVVDAGDGVAGGLRSAQRHHGTGIACSTT